MTFDAGCSSSLITWVIKQINTHRCAVASCSDCVQRAWVLLQSSSDGFSLEHYTPCKGAEVMALAPIHDICRKELLQSSGVLSSLQWWLMAPQILSGSQGVPASRFLVELIFPLFSLEHTPGSL